MRILYLTNGFPYPLTSGYLRHYFFIRELSQRHQITLLSLVDSSFTPDHAEAMAPFTEKVFTFKVTGRRRSMKQKAVSSVRKLLVRNQPIAEMRATIQKLLHDSPYDALFFSGKPTYAAINGLTIPPMVADLCDASSMRIRLQMQFASRWRRPFLAFDYQQVRRIERKIIEQAGALLVASARDSEAVLGGITDKQASIVPNGVDTGYWKRTSDELGHNTIVFTGAMNYAPNADAAVYLAREIFPLVRHSFPDAQLFIVGHSPRPQVVEAGKQPGVTVTGFVPDVRPYLEKATVFVAPLRFGAGIQNKLLEALAMEVPAIGSPLATAGLVSSHNEQPPVLVAESREAYVELIRQQFVARAESPVPHAEGRQYVERNFNWQKSGRNLLDVMNKMAGLA